MSLLRRADNLIQADPTRGEHHLRRAQVLDRLHRSKDALDSYRQAAKAYLLEGQPRKAHATYALVLQRNPSDLEAQLGSTLASSQASAQRPGVHSLRTEPARENERRRTVRARWPKMVNMWGTILREKQNMGHRVVALRGVDVSTNGLGVQATGNFHVGEDVEIAFHHPTFKKPGWARAHVARLPDENQPTVGLQVDWIDMQTLHYLLSVIARETGVPANELAERAQLSL